MSKWRAATLTRGKVIKEQLVIDSDDRLLLVAAITVDQCGILVGGCVQDSYRGAAVQVRELLARLHYSSTNARLSWAGHSPHQLCHSGMAGLIEHLSTEAHNTRKLKPSYTQRLFHGQISDIEP